MATKKTTSRRKPVSRARAGTKPRRGGLRQRAAIRMAKFIAKQGEKHLNTRRTRRDAAILRATHADCAKCGGTGTLYTKAKDGSFSGSKPCPAKPKTMKVSKTQIAIASRVGADKTSGLCGWKCPCGKQEKPRYRTAKDATKALRTHERRIHGGASVGGAWYAQIPTASKPKQLESKAA
ncbi:hypothetical protein [Streptomyces sp. NPDC007063]|uniref:hypothetical protein n=1 Tax=Streptomyces sp. NPDC007063 TaxID=3364772 RepID=UPI003690A8D5